ncbi:MAG TPA: 2-polyprenyl-3-methyl-6-methoxy-1,4-benzoquinone monooxygenase [Burkholderiaceae bacterium]|nr:2-polyprenyl-3-methyl-6-methoxy-1,4-benzoquinone monooxygenase [Burkholderiaceae bacterium]
MTTQQSPGYRSPFLRRMSLMDKVLSEVGRAVQILDGSVHATRPNPAGKAPLAATQDEGEVMSRAEQAHAAGLMRVNHVGEICAQALYRGQATFCGDASIQEVFRKAASEEVDHLVWCRERLNELQSRPSLLNPLWYAGSFTLGAIASKAGRGRNLGFMAETEKQVEQHLDRHLAELPASDERSRKILTQMRDDEIGHRSTAESNGAQRLAKPTRSVMKLMSRIMTTTAYRI